MEMENEHVVLYVISISRNVPSRFIEKEVERKIKEKWVAHTKKKPNKKRRKKEKYSVQWNVQENPFKSNSLLDNRLSEQIHSLNDLAIAPIKYQIKCMQ